MRTIRRSGGDRKQQIVQAALEAIGEYGIRGATISRIAAGAGITPAALYSHFQNRRAILEAALERVFEDIAESFGASLDEEPIGQLNLIFERHSQKVLSQDKTNHAHLFLEFVASAPEEGLRELLREKEVETNARLASVIKALQQRGRLSPDIDAETVAWLVAGWAWTGSVANLMDVASDWNARVSPLMLESILKRVSPAAEESRAVAETDGESEAFKAPALPFDGLPEGTVFTVEEVAAILKVSTDLVRALLEEAQVRAIHLGRDTRIPRRALVALLRGTSEETLEAPADGRAARSPRR